MVTGLVMAGVLGALRAWLVWIVIGGLAGALADRLIQGDQLDILGNIVVGIIGSLMGGISLGVLGIGNNRIIWTFLTSLLGAILLLLIVKAVTRGRGVDNKGRTF